MRVPCEIVFGEEKNEEGIMIPSTVAICPRCGHETMSYGDEERSVRRCLALMREECPHGENNYYVAEYED